MCHTIRGGQATRRDRAADTKRIAPGGLANHLRRPVAQGQEGIADGAIGKMLMSQGSYHRNSTKASGTGRSTPTPGPDSKGDDFIDWKMWLGPAPKRAWDPDRYFRFRKYWDYSGGIATDLFFHVVAPLNICWPEPQFPAK